NHTRYRCSKSLKLQVKTSGDGCRPPNQDPAGADAAKGSVTTNSRCTKRNCVAGLAPARPGREQLPGNPNCPRRLSTRCKLLTATGPPSTASQARAKSANVNSAGLNAKAILVYDSFARSRATASRTISP